MEIVAYQVTYAAGTAMFNASLKTRTEVEEYAARFHGTIKECVLLEEALVAIADAKREYEECKPCS